MSENLNRSTPDFLKYDSMSIEELEVILRADAMGPERDDSDVDEILYVMEVLAKKRRQNGIAGKTALEAYQDFQQHYLPMIEEESEPKRKSNIIPFRRIVAVAASLVLVFSLASSAQAFSFRDVWNAVVTWAQETFSFSMGVEISEPRGNDGLQYESFEEVLTQYKIPISLLPTWIPSDFSLSDIKIDENPLQKTYLAIYTNGDKSMIISIQSYVNRYPEQIEVSKDFDEIYYVSENPYYIINNFDQMRIAWVVDSYECYISGDLTLEEIMLMVDSIK